MPLKINYNAKSFTTSPYDKAFLKGSQTLQFDLAELIHAAITVGRRNWSDVLQFGTLSHFEMIYRAGLVCANLTSESGYIIKSDAYNHLDPSEKGAVSYFLGLTFTKLMAHKLLDVDWLLHVDVYSKYFNIEGKPTRLKSKERPDLIGQNRSGDWVVFEAKGRTGKKPSYLMKKAKRQAEAIATIDKTVPKLGVGSILHFKEKDLRMDWEDPSDFGDEREINLAITREQFYKDYYLQFFKLVEESDSMSYEDRAYQFYRLVNLDITIGILKEIIFQNEGFQNKNFTKNLFKIVGRYEVESSLSELASEQVDRNMRFNGRDGITVILGESWSRLFKD